MKKIIFSFLSFLILFQIFAVSSQILAYNYVHSTQVLLADNNPNPDEIQKQLACGEVGQACCDPGININVSPKLPNPLGGVPFVGRAVGWLESPINALLSIGTHIINWTSNRSSSWFSRPLCINGKASDAQNLNSCVCLDKETFNIGIMCQGISSTSEKSLCAQCSGHGVWTAIGCIDFDLGTFITKSVFSIGISLAGVVSLICIIYSAFILQTSRGNPERLKKAREYLTNCIIGLLLIIFSIFILRLIGVTILQIPGFK